MQLRQSRRSIWFDRLVPEMSEVHTPCEVDYFLSP
jgi:hypothetical protein